MKMRKYVYFIVTLLLLASCINQYKGIQLSTVTVNGRKSNHLIVGRFPDYGDGHKDGCIIRSEMRLELDYNKIGLINGRLSDVSSKEPLKYALVIVNDRLGVTSKIATDSLGHFSAKLEGKISAIQIDYIGYRKLIVKF